jgi:hypothetical protein
MMILARLTRDEEFECASTAFRRNFESPGKLDRSVQKVNLHESIARDAEAIGAELVVAKYFGLKDFEPTVNGFKLHADLGANIEVKWTRWKDGNLILTPRDRDSDVAVLVTGQSPDYYICGWTHVRTARRPARQRGDGSFWINQSDLHPIEDLARASFDKTSL